MKKLILFLIFIYSAFGLIAQTSFSESVKQKISRYQKSHSSITSLFFNQPVYTPGDTAFFSVSVWDAVNAKADAGRKIVDINVWDEQGLATVRSRILVLDGVGKNQILIPSKIRPGRYRLTASFYQSDVVEYQRDLLVVGDWELKSSDNPNEIDAFIEGGHLVEGVSNWIAVRLKQPQTNSNTVVRVKRSSGKVIKDSSLDSFGWAEFQINPSMESYVLEFAGKEIPLPKVETQGFAMHFRNDRESNGPVMEIRQRSLPQNSGNYQLIVVSLGGLEFITKLNLADTLIQISIPPKVRDISQCMIIDENYKVWSSRWLFTGGIIPGASTELALNKKIFTTRDKVDGQLAVPGSVGLLSVRVLKKDLFIKYLGEDGVSSQTSNSSINRSLLARHDEIIPGNSLSAVQQQGTHQPEKFLSIDGQAVFGDTGKPLPDSTMLVLFLQNRLFGYETMLQNGQFKVPLVFDVEGDESIFFTASYKKRDLSNIRIELAAIKGVSMIRAYPAEQDEKPDLYGQYMTRKKVIDRSFRHFSGSQTENNVDPNAKFIEELSGVDITVEPKSHVAFNSMSEVIREILPALEHRTIRDKEVIRLYTTHKRPSNYAGPLFVIDGVVTKNATNFLRIKPSDVLYIKIVKDYNKLRHLGLLTDNGVILVRTRLSEQSFEQENVLPLEGIVKCVDSKVYSGTSVLNDRIPDLRPCLHWSPDAALNEDHQLRVSFFTSDDIGEYVIQIMGVTATGEPFQTEQSFSVVVNK